MLDALQAIVDQPRRPGCVGRDVKRIVCAQVQGDLAFPFQPAEGGGVHEPADLVVAAVDPLVRFAQRGARSAETGHGIVDNSRYLFVRREFDPFR